MTLLKRLTKPLEAHVHHQPPLRCIILAKRKNIASCVVLSAAEFADQQRTPVKVGVRRLSHHDDGSVGLIGMSDQLMEAYEGQHYWAFEGYVYQTVDADLTVEDVLALINESANRRRLQLEKAHALQAMTARLDDNKRRKPIPQDVKIAVWQRDGGQCVECGSNNDLEFDHIIPLALGGANTLRNLQLLCGPCNRRKGATLG